MIFHSPITVREWHPIAFSSWTSLVQISQVLWPFQIPFPSPQDWSLRPLCCPRPLVGASLLALFWLGQSSLIQNLQPTFGTAFAYSKILWGRLTPALSPRSTEKLIQTQTRCPTWTRHLIAVWLMDSKRQFYLTSLIALNWSMTCLPQMSSLHRRGASCQWST